MNRKTAARLRAERLAIFARARREHEVMLNSPPSRRDPDVRRGADLARQPEPTQHEPGKPRPVLIVQTQALLDAEHPSSAVIPLTTNLIDDAAPLRIRIPAAELLPRDSDL